MNRDVAKAVLSRDRTGHSRLGLVIRQAREFQLRHVVSITKNEDADVVERLTVGQACGLSKRAIHAEGSYLSKTERLGVELGSGINVGHEATDVDRCLCEFHRGYLLFLINRSHAASNQHKDADEHQSTDF